MDQSRELVRLICAQHKPLVSLAVDLRGSQELVETHRGEGEVRRRVAVLEQAVPLGHRDVDAHLAAVSQGWVRTQRWELSEAGWEEEKRGESLVAK